MASYDSKASDGTKSSAMSAGGGEDSKISTGNSASANAVAMPSDIPLLTGSEKQIAWAEQLRQEAVEKINSTYNELIRNIQTKLEERKTEIEAKKSELTEKGKKIPERFDREIDGLNQDLNDAKRGKYLVQEYFNKIIKRYSEASYWIDSRYKIGNKTVRFSFTDHFGKDGFQLDPDSYGIS